MDLRKVFDLIPGEIDRQRPRCCPEAFGYIIRLCCLQPDRSMPGIGTGTGTGQAAGPFLRCGCSYTGIEPGGHLYSFPQKRFADYPDFRVINGDYRTVDPGSERFDTVFSAAASR